MKRPVLSDSIMRMFSKDRDFQRFLMDIGGIATDVSEKANKVVGGKEDNIPTLTPDGDLKDGGQSLSDIEARSFFFARIY